MCGPQPGNSGGTWKACFPSNPGVLHLSSDAWLVAATILEEGTWRPSFSGGLCGTDQTLTAQKEITNSVPYGSFLCPEGVQPLIPPERQGHTNPNPHNKRPSEMCPPRFSRLPLPPCCRIWIHFVPEFMAGPAGSCRLYCLGAEVTHRFMGAINPRPISALIEAICIVTKIIRDNFMGIFLKIIMSHIFKLYNSGGKFSWAPQGP